MCTDCTIAVYCGKECQRAHWREHKPECRARYKPLMTRLGELAVALADMMPGESEGEAWLRVVAGNHKGTRKWVFPEV